MAEYEIPNAVQVQGITLTPHISKAGQLNNYVLDKNTDVVIATYPRTGRFKQNSIVSLINPNIS